jgi:hypothetical protein
MLRTLRGILRVRSPWRLRCIRTCVHLPKDPSCILVRSSSDHRVHEDLPAYLTDPPSAQPAAFSHLGQGLLKVRHWAVAPTPRTGDPSVPFGGRKLGLSPVFTRMIRMRRSGLATALDGWWATAARADAVLVRRRLLLGPPQGNASAGWVMVGRVRHLTTLRSVPVVVELWPIHEAFTKVTMTPQIDVRPSKRYFRLGHAVLDRLETDLSEAAERGDVGTY